MFVVTLLAVVLAAVAAASAHLPVSTPNPQAKAAFDRGLFLYYAYNGDDSVRDFTQAATLDSRLAMAYWGIALAQGPDLNTPITQERFTAAADGIRKATAMDGDASALERGLIAAMALRYKGTFSDWASDDQAYRNAMLALAESSHDENVALLAAEALLEHGGLEWSNGTLADPGSRTALQLVDGVLHDDASSVIANHLCIHLYDLAPDRTPALACAKALDATTFSPGAEHLAHMPAHYWIETGDYAAALRSSDRAYALMQQLQADADSVHTQHYEKHDAAVGYSAAMMLGNYADALRWSERMTAAFGQSFVALTALRFGRYDVAYAAAGNQFAGKSVRGLAALQLGHNDEAVALAKRVAASDSAPGYLPQLFLARLAEAQGNAEDAQRRLERARANQQTGLGGELIPWLPAGEALGTFALRRGDNAGAVTAFRATLQAYPNDPRALYGLSQALSAQSNAADAAAARSQYQEMWKGADTPVADALP
jgi:hypothetical protein